MEKIAGRSFSPKKFKAFQKSDFVTTGSIDIPFFVLVMTLLAIGLVMLLSASYPDAYYNEGQDSFYFFRNQCIFAAVGVAAMLIFSRLNYKWLQVFAIPIALVSLLLLVIVLFYHTDFQDFKRWIPIGPFTLQPSDIAKFALVVIMSAYISKYCLKMKKVVYGIVIPLAMIAVFCVLIALENHMSCTILMFCIGAALMWVGGTPAWLFIVGLGAVAAAVVVCVTNPQILPDYVQPRILAWVDKTYEPTDGRWQINNSLYAIGSGGFFGEGLGNSKQKYLYVSEPQNDFIFSIVCEELGFIGAAVIIVLFALLIWRGMIIAVNCEDRFGALLVIGIVAQVGIQVVFNILVVTDLLPNTGIALPFFSYGGTAMMMLLGEMGVVLSVSRRTKVKKLN